MKKKKRKRSSPLIRPSASNVRARSGGQPEHSRVVVRGIFDSQGKQIREENDNTC